MRSPPFRGFPSPKKPLTVTRDVWLISSDRISTYATIAAAVAAASNGDTILIWSGTYNIATLVIDKSVTLTSLDRDNTIISVASGHSINPTADNVTLVNLTIDNTAGGTVAACIISANDNLRFENLKLTKTSGAPSSIAAGIWNFGGANWVIDGVEATVTTGANKYGYLADTAASSAKIKVGLFDGATNDIRTNHASATIELEDPKLKNSGLLVSLGTVTGWYYDGLDHRNRATGDLFPVGFGSGLAERFVDYLGGYTYHFRDGAIPGGYTWDSTPSVLDYSLLGDFLSTRGDGASSQHFLYKAVGTISGNPFLDGRFRTPDAQRMGLRIAKDGGGTSPFAEGYVEGTSGQMTVTLRYRNATGGGITTVTTSVSLPDVQFIGLRLLYISASDLLQLYSIGEGGSATFLAASAAPATTWVNTSTGRAGVFVYGLSSAQSECDGFTNGFE